MRIGSFRGTAALLIGFVLVVGGVTGVFWHLRREGARADAAECEWSVFVGTVEERSGKAIGLASSWSRKTAAGDAERALRDIDEALRLLDSLRVAAADLHWNSLDRATEVLDGANLFMLRRELRRAAILERGRALALRGEHRAAIEELTRAIESGPSAVQPHLERIRSLRALHEHEKAREEIEQGLARKPTDFRFLIERARLHAALGDVARARDDLDEAIDAEPASPDGYFARAELLRALGEPQEAIRSYETALVRSERDYRSHLGLGRASEDALDYERAAQQYERLLDVEDEGGVFLRPAALAAKGRLLLLRSDPQEVEVEADLELRSEHLVKASPPLAPATDSEVVARARGERRKREEDALRCFDQALALAPRLLDALVGRARLSLAKDDGVAARADLSRARELLGERGWVREKRPHGPDPELSTVEALLGHAAALEGEWDEAIARFAAARVADPGSAFALAGLGRAWHAKGDVVKARSFFEAARGAEAADSFYKRALVHARDAERSLRRVPYGAARLAFARALHENPYHSLALVGRARLSVAWHSWDSAMEDLSRAVTAAPYCGAAREMRGFLLARDLPAQSDAATGRPRVLRDPARAVEDFTAALELAAKDPGAREATLEGRYGRALARAGPAADERALDEALHDLREAAKEIPESVLPWIEAEKTSAERVLLAAELHDLQARILERRVPKDTEGVRAARARAEEVRRHVRSVAARLREQATALMKADKYAEALAKLDRAIALDATEGSAFVDRFRCSVGERDDEGDVPGVYYLFPVASLQALDDARAFELAPDRIWEQHLERTDRMSFVIDLKRVDDTVSLIVADHPDLSAAWFLLGFHYVTRIDIKRYDRTVTDPGIAAFDRAIGLAPRHAAAHAFRGYLHYKAGLLAPDAERRDDFERAAKDFERAIELEPESALVRFHAALLWSARSEEPGTEAEKGRFRDRAVADLARAFGSMGYSEIHNRFRNERGFGAVRDDPRVGRLLWGK